MPETRRLRLRTLTFLGSDVLDLDPADVSIGKRHLGQLWAPDLASPGLTKFQVNAPWGAVHVKGRRWPLIVDLQGHLRGEVEPNAVPPPKKRRRKSGIH